MTAVPTAEAPADVGVHVEPGDIAIADQTGICFVPVDSAEKTLHRIVEVAEEEKRLRRGV